ENAIKAGVGVFHTDVDSGITFETRRLDGTRQRQLLIDDPLFFSTIPRSLTASSAIEPTTYTKSPDLAMPHSLRTSIGYERQLPADAYNHSAEMGPLANDDSHNFVTGGTLSLPHEVYLSSYLMIASGRRFNITTGRDNNNDSVFTDRPAFAQAGDLNTIVTPY